METLIKGYNQIGGIRPEASNAQLLGLNLLLFNTGEILFVSICVTEIRIQLLLDEPVC